MSRKGLLILISVFLLYLVLGFGLFSSAGRDDVYITYWVSYALSHFGELVNFNGAFVEQSSSLLHVLLVGLLNYIMAIPVHILGPVFSLGFAFLTLFMTFKLGERWSSKVGFISVLILSTSTYFIYWGLSGMESTLMTFIVVSLIYYLALYFSDRTTWRRDFVLFFLVLLFLLVRPENQFVMVSMIAGYVGVFLLLSLTGIWTLKQHISTKLLKISVISSLAILVILLFRSYYFGAIFPQPVYAKSTGMDMASVREGFEYLTTNLSSGLWEIKILVVGISLFYISRALLSKKEKPGNDFGFFATLSGTLFVTAYSAFIIFSGGDWMEGGRFLVPLLPFVSLLIACSFELFPLNRKTEIAAIVLIIVLQIGISLNFATERSAGMPISSGYELYSSSFGQRMQERGYSWFEITNRVHLRDLYTLSPLRSIIERVVQEKSGKVEILTMQMGMVPYFLSLEYFGDIEFTDLKGLTDRKFINCVDDFYLTKTNSGIDINLEYYLRYRDLFNKKCSITKPDIIYSLGEPSDFNMGSVAGYKVIYKQKGGVESGSYFFHGAEIKGEGASFIAVRKELADQFRYSEKISVDSANLGL